VDAGRLLLFAFSRMMAVCGQKKSPDGPGSDFRPPLPRFRAYGRTQKAESRNLRGYDGGAVKVFRPSLPPVGK
jgi:hypothetical protein